MAKCAICDKTQSNGKKLRAVVDGEVKRIHVCAKCLKNGKVKRA